MKHSGQKKKREKESESAPRPFLYETMSQENYSSSKLGPIQTRFCFVIQLRIKRDKCNHESR